MQENKPLTLQQIRREHEMLEGHIGLLISAFERHTGVLVESIYINRNDFTSHGDTEKVLVFAGVEVALDINNKPA